LDAEKALRLAQTQTFDLITLDLEMPGSAGLNFSTPEANPPLERNTHRFHPATPPLKISSAALTLARRISLRSRSTRKIFFPAFFHWSKKPPRHDKSIPTI
jgi:CheY-like chemotaxis protein